MTDQKSDAETLYGADEAQNPSPGTARIELWYWPIAYHGHAFLRLVKPDGKVEDLHGYPASRNADTRPRPDGKPERGIIDGSSLTVLHEPLDSAEDSKYEDSRRVATVASGSSDQIAEIWQRGMAAMDAINSDKTIDYKAFDPSFLAGGSGGKIQNSNSAIYTLSRAMNLNLDGAVRDAGIERKLPGWGRNLFDPKYERYMAPPTFPVKDAP
ncbi:MAG: hypothetical protein EXR12_11940 [Rhodospirillaceae bacterium]|nr:hypothetical protein [Rhodospirillaceae bacterium]